jgi:hypothetical protein
MRPSPRAIRLLGVIGVVALGGGCVFSPALGNGDVHCGPSGECPPNMSCRDDGLCWAAGTMAAQPSAGACIPLHCYIGYCGPIEDGCGKTIDCGPCTTAIGSADMAGCTPKRSCEKGVTCGTIDDGCGRPLHCGPCPTAQACSNTTPNQCICTPKSCADVGATCGRYPDGCGTILDCFPDGGTSCAVGRCGGGGPYTCGKGDGCVPLTTCPPHACGPIPNGCNGVLRCGACTAPEVCGGGGKPNVCG